MLKYSNSNKIDVFPISKRRSGDAYAHVLTEKNLLDLIRSVSFTDSFVLTTAFNSNQRLDFVIHGYYIQLHEFDVSTFDSTATDIYAHIFIDTSTTEHFLWGSDDDKTTQFTGVVFTDTPTCDAPAVLKNNFEHYSLKVLTKVGGAFQIPSDSRRVIDGGLIE